MTDKLTEQARLIAAGAQLQNGLPFTATLIAAGDFEFDIAVQSTRIALQRGEKLAEALQQIVQEFENDLLDIMRVEQHARAALAQWKNGHGG